MSMADSGNEFNTSINTSIKMKRGRPKGRLKNSSITFRIPLELKQYVNETCYHKYKGNVSSYLMHLIELDKRGNYQELDYDMIDSINEVISEFKDNDFLTALHNSYLDKDKEYVYNLNKNYIRNSKEYRDLLKLIKNRIKTTLNYPIKSIDDVSKYVSEYVCSD